MGLLSGCLQRGCNCERRNSILSVSTWCQLDARCDRRDSRWCGLELCNDGRLYLENVAQGASLRNGRNRLASLATFLRLVRSLASVRDLAVVLMLCFVLAAPLWIVRYPPLLDYPNHLARSYILRQLQDESHGLHKYYRADWGPFPYLVEDLSLIALQGLFAVATAGKIFLSIVLLAIPFSAWFFLRQANPGNDALAAWASLSSYNSFFLMGFINSTLAIAVCFLALGLGLRFLARPSPATWVVAFLTVSFLYFTHLWGFLVAGFVLIAYIMLQSVSRRTLMEMLACGLWFLPGALLYWYVRGGTRPPTVFPGPVAKILGLAEPIRSYSKVFDLLTMLLVLAGFVALCYRNP